MPGHYSLRPYMCVFVEVNLINEPVVIFLFVQLQAKETPDNMKVRLT